MADGIYVVVQDSAAPGQAMPDFGWLLSNVAYFRLFCRMPTHLEDFNCLLARVLVQFTRLVKFVQEVDQLVRRRVIPGYAQIC